MARKEQSTLPVTGSAETGVLSVTELTTVLNLTLEEQLGTVIFEGEIGELSRPASGHIYATLKDSNSQISIVLWSATARSLTFAVTQGLQVRCRGRANIYPKSGRFQMIVTKMEPAGEGLLRKKFLELKAKLENEGLFAVERKRPLPFLPKAIGLVTSQSGAAIHDMLVKLRERMPQIPVYLVDVRVQGPGSAEEIARGINLLSESGLVDVMIVGRGGGSLEDLWAFNEEVVVRAIFAAKVPVISAVGHEVDISLSDYAADLRAPTPTAAAERVVPHRADLIGYIDEMQRRLFEIERWLGPLGQHLDEYAARLDRSTSAMLNERRLRLQTAEAHLRAMEPSRVFHLLRERVLTFGERLASGLQAHVLSRATLLERLEARLRHALPPQRVEILKSSLDRLETHLLNVFTHQLHRREALLDTLTARLTAISPQKVLERGYALIEKEGRAVSSVTQLAVGSEVAIAFHDGNSGAKILTIHPLETKNR